MALALVQEVVSFPNNLDIHQKAPTSPENHGTFKYQAVLLYSLSNKNAPTTSNNGKYNDFVF